MQNIIKSLAISAMLVGSLNADYKLILTDKDGVQTEECIKSYSFSNNLESIAKQKGVTQDIYSEEEVMTNKVYLGKPVYRRVFLFDDYTVSYGEEILKKTPVISTALERIVNIDYKAIYNGNNVLSPSNSFYGTTWYRLGNCDKVLKTCSFNIRHQKSSVPTMYITDLRIAVEYTKTTDVTNAESDEFKSYLHYVPSSSTTEEVITKNMKNIGVQFLEGYTYDSATSSCNPNQ